jgi:carboxynorspermidine decarboxylase
MINPHKVPSPCFVLEEELLIRNLEILKRVQMESEAKIICALKAFSMYSVFPLIGKYLKGTTASSLYEAKLGYEEFGGEVHAYSPAFLPAEFEELTKYCDHLSFNSLSQWEHFKELIKENPKKISCGLRINPEYSEVETDLYNPAAPGSRLGIPAYLLENLPAGIEGLHSHTLFESSAETLENTWKAIEEKFGHHLPALKWINLGGGHAITRKGYNLDLLIELIKSIRHKYKVEVILEPGSAVAWETGYLVSTVVDLVDYHGEKTAVLDTSFAAHMPDCIEMPYKPKILGATDAKPGAPNVYSMGGLTCLAGDFMSGYSFEKPLQVGDKIIFNDMMHYTMVKTTTFNGVNHPAIGIWHQDNSFELIKSFDYTIFRSKL